MNLNYNAVAYSIFKALTKDMISLKGRSERKAKAESFSGNRM
ncbi:hypothetical protein [Paenibacillus polymyxa]|nr:hypothetical protein [Paenibacillus polymyxa]